MGDKWLYKWDYKRFNFKKINEEIKRRGSGIGINYGRLYLDKEKVIKSKNKTGLKQNDEVFIMFYNIPKSPNRIILKLSNLHFIASKDGEFNYNVKKGEHFYEEYSNGKFQKVAHATKVQWVIDLDDGTKFTKIDLEFNKRKISNRPIYQKIKDEELIEELNNNLYSFSKLNKDMSKINTCILKNKKISNNHKTFINKLYFPYVETHHFVMKYILKDFEKKNTNNRKLVNELNSLIEDPRNLILLCPVCHRKIHQGLNEDIKIMIKGILDNNNALNELLNEVIDFLKKHDRKITKIDLISEMYNIDKDINWLENKQ